MVVKRNLLFSLLFFCLCLKFGGCAIRSNQLEQLNKIYNQDVDTLAPYTWNLQFGDYESSVLAIQINELLIFSNHLGDAVVLQNYELKETHRLGLFRHFWQIMSNPQVNTLYKQGRRVSTYECSQWTNTSNLRPEKKQIGYTVFRQLCRGGNDVTTQNTIYLNEQNQITYLEYFLIGEQSPIKIKKQQM